MTDKGFHDKEQNFTQSRNTGAKNCMSKSACGKNDEKTKTFRILRCPIPLTTKPYINAIVTVCAALVNLRRKIVKEQD